MTDFLYYNPNPNQRYRADGTSIKKDNTGDCSVRCICKALDINWEEAYKLLCDEGLKQHKMPDSTEVIAAVLESNGFKKGVIFQDYIRKCHHRPTVNSAIEDFKRYNKKKLVFKTTHHVTTVDEGIIYDTWNTADEPVWSFWYK